MATINSALNLIANALNADQTGLNVVANNVANANTTGYTEETSDFEENSPVTINGVQYGSGVTNTGAVSQRDLVLEQRLDQQQQLSAASSARLTALDSLQAVFTPATGSSTTSTGDIGTDLTNFFSSFTQLESEPADNAYRQNVLSAATQLAGDISNASASLTAQQSSLNQEAASVASQVNALTTSLASLNQQITSISPDADAGVLEDQRQQDLSQLSQLIGINEVTTESNGISVTTSSGQLLVSEGNSYSLTTGTVDGATHFFLGTTDITSDLESGGGQLGGLLTVRDQDIPGVQAELDQLAYSVSTNVNSLNNSGADLSGNTNAGDIFYQPSEVSGSAATISVVLTDPNSIAAASAGGGSGDNTNATALANLGNSDIVSGDTPSNYYSNLVSALGATVSEVTTENTALSASVSQLQTQRDSLSGVSLDNEASSMQELERSYQAASQVFTILNTIFASTLNLGTEAAVN